MVKYSEEFKLQVVREYIEGPLGYKLLVKKYGMKSATQIRQWVAVYQKYGEDGLKRKKTKEVYSVQFKLNILRFMKKTGTSINETAYQFNILNPPMITAWKKIFLEGGAEALNQPRGRPPMSDKAKNNKKKEHNQEMTLNKIWNGK